MNPQSERFGKIIIMPNNLQLASISYWQAGYALFAIEKT
jgi:hypothetical protein